MKKQSRRQFIKTAAAAGAVGAASIVAPFTRTAHSAGKLNVGLWDHWVPGANDVSRGLIEEWAAANNVEVTVDYITSAGSKLLITAQAESRARTGHDIFVMAQWMATIHRDNLEPVTDVVDDLVAASGPISSAAAYVARFDGEWFAVPGPVGSQTHPMISRLDRFSEIVGVDLRGIFPAGPDRNPELVETWNYGNFLGHAQKLHAAGHPFGNPLGSTSDAQIWLGALMTSFGSQMVDAEGDITVDSDETRQALDYLKRLTQYMPEEIYAWDDASNNRWIISGRGSAIFNPPSAWTVAKRDRIEVASQLWHHDTPRGPRGRFRGTLPFMTGIWRFSENKSAAKDLLRYLCGGDRVYRLNAASQGYDLPLQTTFYDNPIWTEIGPPVGTQYNYPMRGDEVPVLTGYPAPPDIAAQIQVQALISNLVARVTQANESFDDAIAWAENEIEGLFRG